MNDQTIQMIAQAIIANTKVIQSLIDALPHEATEKVAAIVTPTAPVAPAPKSEPVQVVESKPVVQAPVMPAPPTFTAPAAPAPVSTAAPFIDSKGLIDYVMTKYKALGPQKGSQIQAVLTGLGFQNINDVKPDNYAALYAGIEAIQ